MRIHMVKKIRKKKKVMFYSKKGEFELTDYDDGSRSLIVSPELEEALKEQRKLFIKKFGREPTPDEPIFFDPDADTPQPYSEENFNKTFIEDMRKAGIDERYIKAYKKTGLLVTQDNMDLLTPEEIEEFEKAMLADDE